MIPLSRGRKTLTEQQLLTGKRRRKMREALTGYLFVFPAAVATFVFGLWPVVAGFYESLKTGSPRTNRYAGLYNYVRSLSSLTYIFLFAVCAIFLYLAYRSWRSAYLHRQRNLWAYVIPGVLGGMGLIVLAFTFVTGTSQYNWFAFVLFTLALVGFYAADMVQGPRAEWDIAHFVSGALLLCGLGTVWIVGPALFPDNMKLVQAVVLLAISAVLLYFAFPYLLSIKTGRTIGTMFTMGTLMVGGLLLARYTTDQMEHDVAEAQRISTQIFNQNVLNGTVSVPEEAVQLGGLRVAGDVMVDVTINGETVTAPLAPDAFTNLSADDIAGLQTSVTNNQKVKVIVNGEEVEGQVTGLRMGKSLPIPLEGDSISAVRETDIYSALEVGEEVIRANGHTEPLWKQMDAALGVFLCVATIMAMSYTRRRIDDDIHPHIYRWLHIGRIAMGVVIAGLFFYLISSVQLNYQTASGMRSLSEDQFQQAYQYATGTKPHPSIRAENLATELLYWPQVFLMGTGALLIGMAYLVWQNAQKRETKLGFGSTMLLAVIMMVAGWMTISELPRIVSMASSDTEDTFKAMLRTAMYAIGTVPVQLTLGLFLAYLLFSEVSWGKSIFRVIYFMPYIAPSVATSTVFLVIFSPKGKSLANQILGALGSKPQLWLKEPEGIFRLIYEHALHGNPLNIPGPIQGPSLALVTVIIYNIWVFAGYNAVVFLAGLGSIPGELYEAAEVDGAGRWARFRKITLPLLSPTTFFLTMLSIIGTFKAFTHIYVLRNQTTGKEIDTMSVYIFTRLYDANDPGHAAALAFILFGTILILTLVQNRLTREQVFYG